MIELKNKSTCKGRGLRMDGPSVEHGHDLTYKLFGKEIGVWQDLCTDQLHHLVDKKHTAINQIQALLNLNKSNKIKLY